MVEHCIDVIGPLARMAGGGKEKRARRTESSPRRWQPIDETVASVCRMAAERRAQTQFVVHP